MWIDLDGSEQMASINVTVRLADSRRTYEEKTLTLHHGEAISPVELTIPMSYDGQLTVRLGCGSPQQTDGNESGNGSKVTGIGGCQSEEFPVHPLEAIQSLSLRLERTVYHPDDVGNNSSNFFFFFILENVQQRSINIPPTKNKH